jgi:hypothetical protein
MHDVYRARLDFNRRTLAGAYKAVGHQDPRWDDAANKLLDAFALYFTYDAANVVYQPPDVPTRADLWKLGYAANQAGCDDPLVLYCMGVIFHEHHMLPAASFHIEKAARGLTKRAYPPLRIMAAHERMAKVLAAGKQDPELVPQYRDRATKYALAALTVKIDPRDLREHLHQVNGYFNALPVDQRLAFCDALAASKDTDPWLLDMLRGNYEKHAAWAARGDGFADTVTPEGWKGFREHLASARDHLVKAHGRHPEFPDAAADMISVAMGGGEHLRENTRDWFDKATAAQPDWPSAYHNYLWSIYPRWGGSHREMIAFGLECLATDRYDTAIPNQFLTAVEKIDEDLANDFSVFKLPTVKAALDRMFEKQVEKAPHPKSRDLVASRHLAYCWRQGDYPRAARILETLGPGAADEPISRFGGWPPAVFSEIRAMTSPQAPLLAAAAKADAAGDRDAAIEKFTAAADKLGPDHPGHFFARARAKSLQLARDFDNGDWVSLNPEPDFLPWTVLAGNWSKSRDGTTLTGAPGDNGQALLLCRHNFGRAFEIRAKVESPDPERPAPLTIFIEFNPATGHTSPLGIDPKKKTVYAGGYYTRVDKPVELKPAYDLSARVKDGRISVTLDGNPVIENAKIDLLRNPDQSSLALGTLNAPKNHPARYTNLQIRKLPN